MKIYNLKSEAAAWEEVQRLRRDFNPELLKDIRINSRGEAVERATEVIQRLLTDLKDYNLNFPQISPGHGSGHLTRDFVNARILFRNLEADPRDAFVGFVGGSLHDIGCVIISRYEESTRAVRHAEAGALFARHLLENQKDLSDLERTAIAYSIAAHTHYRGESEVKCDDGETRIVKPYMELDKNGKPVWPVCFTRWVDRLDCNGPAYLGRHYLTLAEEHKDFDGLTHFDVRFAHHMTPLLRHSKDQVDDKGVRNQTMSEHMKMFADSQTNESPYGKYDYGFMVQLRDGSKDMLNRIVHVTQVPTIFNPEREREIREVWRKFLYGNVEPSMLGLVTSGTLDGMFGELEDKTRYAWCSAFLTTIYEYSRWAEERLKYIEGQDSRSYSFKPITDDVREVIKPRYWE